MGVAGFVVVHEEAGLAENASGYALPVPLQASQVTYCLM